MNSVEIHFVISSRIRHGNRTYTLSATCSFCSTLFSTTNQTKMRIHLTGEREGQTRVAACRKVPPACRQFYLNKKASDQTAQSAKLTNHRKLIRQVIDEHAPDLPCAGQKRVCPSDPSNVRCLTAPANLPNGQLPLPSSRYGGYAAGESIDVEIVSFSSSGSLSHASAPTASQHDTVELSAACAGSGTQFHALHMNFFDALRCTPHRRLKKCGVHALRIGEPARCAHPIHHHHDQI